MPQLTDPAERLQAMVERANAVADQGAEWLKIFATTGTADDLSGERIYSYEEIKAATDTAHARGLKVALHAYGPSVVSDAIRAGVDSIEHAVDVDDVTLQAWAEAGIAYVPTIDHNRYYAEHRIEYGYGEQTAEDLLEFTASNVAMLHRAYQAGIPIVFGSDAVMSMFGQNSRELEWFLQAGLSPAEIIRTATLNSARLLGRDTDSIQEPGHVPLGRLAPGYAADIIAVAGNPLVDLKFLTSGVEWVMKDGVVQDFSGRQ